MHKTKNTLCKSPLTSLSYDLDSVFDNQKALKNTFQVTTFKVEENLRTFQGKWNLRTIQWLPLKFKDFPRLCKPCLMSRLDRMAHHETIKILQKIDSWHLTKLALWFYEFGVKGLPYIYRQNWKFPFNSLCWKLWHSEDCTVDTMLLVASVNLMMYELGTF